MAERTSLDSVDIHMFGTMENNTVYELAEYNNKLWNKDIKNNRSTVRSNKGVPLLSKRQSEYNCMHGCADQLFELNGDTLTVNSLAILICPSVRFYLAQVVDKIILDMYEGKDCALHKYCYYDVLKIGIDNNFKDEKLYEDIDNDYLLAQARQLVSCDINKIVINSKLYTEKLYVDEDMIMETFMHVLESEYSEMNRKARNEILKLRYTRRFYEFCIIGLLILLIGFSFWIGTLMGTIHKTKEKYVQILETENNVLNLIPTIEAVNKRDLTHIKRLAFDLPSIDPSSIGNSIDDIKTSLLNEILNIRNGVNKFIGAVEGILITVIVLAILVIGVYGYMAYRNIRRIITFGKKIAVSSSKLFVRRKRRLYDIEADDDRIYEEPMME